MDEYKNLVLALRIRAVNLKEKFSTNAMLLAELMDAANAIEELANARNELSAMCLKLTRTIDEMETENMRHERGDGF